MIHPSGARNRESLGCQSPEGRDCRHPENWI